MSCSLESPVPALAGPTASGKTALACLLAERRPIEAVSVDSMQVYRGVNIGAAKPSASERKALPHHLIDMAAPEERYDLARFMRDADRAIAGIRSRGRIPLLIGGTGMYWKALREGIFDVPSRDADVRSRLEARVANEGCEALLDELRNVDSDTANRLSPNDAIRIVRTLEVHETTGRSMSDWQRDPGKNSLPPRRIRMAVLTRRRDTLATRINQRVDAMMRAGWVDEVAGLLAQGASPRAHCFKALGYGEIVNRLMHGRNMGDLREAIARDTRQFAKRQMTWFRAMPGAVWLDADVPEITERLVEKLDRFLFGD